MSLCSTSSLLPKELNQTIITKVSVFGCVIYSFAAFGFFTTGIYVLSLMLTMMLSIMMTIVILKMLHQNGKQRMPKWARTIVFDVLCRCVCCNKGRKMEKHSSDTNQSKPCQSNGSQSDNNTTANNTIVSPGGNQQRSKSHEWVRDEWRKAAYILETVTISLTMGIFLVATIVCVFLAPAVSTAY